MAEQVERNESEEREVTFFRFEDLRIYHKSLDYNNWLCETSIGFPDNEKTGLLPKFSLAARNISFFIADGSARNKTQFINYLKMAKSAIRECMVYTTIAYRAEYLNDEQEDVSRNFLMEMTKMIGALISSLQRSNNNHNNYGDPNYNNRSRYDGNTQVTDDYRNEVVTGY